MTIYPQRILEIEKVAADFSDWTMIRTALDNDFSNSIVFRNTLLTRIQVRFDGDETENKFITIDAGEKFILDGIAFSTVKGKTIEAKIVPDVLESFRVNLL
jgi:hypothetical protein